MEEQCSGLTIHKTQLEFGTESYRSISHVMMKFAIGIACLSMALMAQSAPQSGPILGRPWEDYAPQCRPPPCPATGNGSVAYPLDCLQYVECTNGVAKVRPCPPDLAWNEAGGNCAEQKLIGCKQCW